MDIRSVRTADQWCGVPLCGLLSAVEALRRRLRRPAPGAPPEAILVIGISEMGSAILSYPMLCEARKRYPGATLHFLTFRKVSGAVQLLDLLPEENVITLDDRSLWRFLASFFRLVLRTRRLRIDTVLDMELFARISAIISYLSGASTRVGFFRYKMEGLYRGNLLTHRVQYNPYQHIAINQMALLDALSEDVQGTPLVKRDYSNQKLNLPRLINTPQESEKIRQKLQSRCPDLSPRSRIVLFNPGGGELPIRAWPLENYIGLARMLLEEKEISVGVLGLDQERIWYRRMASQIDSSRFFDFTGMTETVREVVTLFNCCDVLVTADSGPAHFAGLSGIHCVVFFGPETPVLYGPIGDRYTCLYAGLSCSPCLTAYNHRNTPCDGNNVCVQQFRPREVRETILRILREPEGAPSSGTGP